MLYSKTAQYSIQSMLFITANRSEKNILVRDVAKELQLPSSFLSKILQTLSRYGFLNSVKGPRGGFSISEKGAASSIAQLVEVIDGPMDFEMCIAGFSPCSSENACPLHDSWKVIREEIKYLVSTKSIEELAIEMPIKYKVMLLGKYQSSRKPKAKKTPVNKNTLRKEAPKKMEAKKKVTMKKKLK